MPKFLVRHLKPLSLVLGVFGIYLTYIFINIIKIKPDGVYLGHDHVWADWPLHIGIAGIFATRSPENWFNHHPMYAHGKFTYSFLMDFISGILMRVGFGVEFAFILPSIILSIFLIIGMYILIYLVSGRAKISVIAIFIFFLASGPGFLGYLSDMGQNPNLDNLTYPQKHYSRNDNYAWYAGNFIVGMLVPQRNFLLGLTIGVWSLGALVYGLRLSKIGKREKTYLIIGGIGAGLLAISHVHSLIVVTIICSIICLGLFQKIKTWVYFALPASITALILYFTFIAGGVENKEFFRMQIGFTSKGDFLDWVIMWIRVWGVMLPVALYGFFKFPNRNLVGKMFLLGIFVVFGIANLVLFQPIEWDNSKLFLWSYLGFSILASYVIVGLFENKRYSVFCKISGLVILICLCLTGVTELVRYANIERNSYQGISREDMNLGDQVRWNTDETAVFLTTTSTNHWVMMWASRPIMMGFVGWVNNFGFLYNQRLTDMGIMFRGESGTRELFEKYNICYVVIGMGEIMDFSANEQYYATNYTLEFSNDRNKVYKVCNNGYSNSN
ncbi:MAG: hypothetical protein M3P33_03515 [bacterium]|nr:hypothetical protein [bacterium]